jgi:AcrR family transcriptional regulator
MRVMASESSSTHSKILEYGTNLLSRSGFSGVTLGVLAEQANMSKSGLFAHFRSKEEVQLQLLENTAKLSSEYVVAPAMRAAEGLPRLKALVENWLGWSGKAGLSGGCAVAAGMFEFDDCEGPIRDRLLAMEKFWRDLLARHVMRAVELKHLRAGLDIDQFVWELCGIYLSHHASVRFVRDKSADRRARLAFDALIGRALPAKRK